MQRFVHEDQRFDVVLLDLVDESAEVLLIRRVEDGQPSRHQMLAVDCAELAGGPVALGRRKTSHDGALPGSVKDGKGLDVVAKRFLNGGRRKDGRIDYQGVAGETFGVRGAVQVGPHASHERFEKGMKRRLVVLAGKEVVNVW